MRVGPPGMAMNFDPVAVPFAGEPGDMGFELLADPVTAGTIFDREIADAGKVAVESDLGNKMKGEEGDDFGVQFINEQDFVGMCGQSPDLFFQ
jgi:hypothetical protein